MILETSRFGRLDVPEEKILTFSDGLYGFGDCHRFIVLEIGGGIPGLKWLQSVDDGALAFVIADPAVFWPNYRPEVPKADLAEMGLRSVEEGIVMAVCSVPETPRGMTANLQAPLVINPADRKGRQVVLSSPEYGLKNRVFPAATTAQPVPAARPSKGG